MTWTSLYRGCIARVHSEPGRGRRIRERTPPGDGGRLRWGREAGRTRGSGVLDPLSMSAVTVVLGAVGASMANEAGRWAWESVG
ncbi:hypothetical protein KCMC57_up30290 [Kitasatospora sp. CMC57]|uniref:Uncharacterized protein n=1 Tax=Kitasatospora sp. CMC57 TaxID=3231513 RepID=A0AB33JTS0_9ACTN